MQSQDKNDSNSSLSQKHKVELNYKFLYSSKNEEYCNELSILDSIQEEFELEDSLKHPLIQVYLYVMWREMVKFHIGSIIFHILQIFFTFMSANSHLFTPGNGTSMVEFNSTEAEEFGIVLVANLILTFLTFTLLAKQIIQMSLKWYQIQKSKNKRGQCKKFLWLFLDLEWVILILSFLFLLLQFLQISDSTIEFPEELINHFSAWIMLTASFFIFWKMGRLPRFTFYIYFMAKVARNFLKLLIPVLIVFIAFAASFYSVFKTRTEPEESDELTDFSNIWRSIARTFVMSTGEFEYSSFSVGQEEFTTIAFISSVMMNLLFIFLLALVLMNVLTGLAVSDAEDMKEEILLRTMQMRLKEALYLNGMKKWNPIKPLFNWIDKIKIGGKLLTQLKKEERKITIYINKRRGKRRVNRVNDGEEQHDNDGNKQHENDGTHDLDIETLDKLRSHYFKKLAEIKSNSEDTNEEELKTDEAIPNNNEALELQEKLDTMETNILDKMETKILDKMETKIQDKLLLHETELVDKLAKMMSDKLSQMKGISVSSTASSQADPKVYDTSLVVNTDTSIQPKQYDVDESLSPILTASSQPDPNAYEVYNDTSVTTI